MKIKAGAEKLLLALPSGDGTQPTRPETNRISRRNALFVFIRKHMRSKYVISVRKLEYDKKK